MSALLWTIEEKLMFFGVFLLQPETKKRHVWFMFLLLLTAFQILFNLFG